MATTTRANLHRPAGTTEMSTTNQQRFHAALEAQKRGLNRGTNAHQAFVDGYVFHIEETTPKPYICNDQEHFNSCTVQNCARCLLIRRAKDPNYTGLNWCDFCQVTYYSVESHAHTCRGRR